MLCQIELLKSPKLLEGSWFGEADTIVAVVLQGIYLTLERQADGRHKLLRIRFNRNVYSKKEAEVWWNQSKHALAKAHNLAPGRVDPPDFAAFYPFAPLLLVL